MIESGLPKAFFITDSESFDPLPVIATLPANVGIIIRDYDHPHRAQFAKTIRTATKNIVLVAKDVLLAEKIKADGVHIPEFMINEIPEIRKNQPKWIITSAAHDMNSADKAVKVGANIIFLSPVFATSSHAGKPPLNPEIVREITKKHANVYALGGINIDNILKLANIGFAGFSAISAFNNCAFVATLAPQT